MPADAPPPRSPARPSTAAVTLALLCTVGVAVLLRGAPPLPGDVALTRAVQGLVTDPTWVTPFVSTATWPLKGVLWAVAVLGAWRMAGRRTAGVVLAAVVLEQLASDPLKAFFGRPRPSPEFVAVVGTHRGLSFPSSFVSTYSVTLGALYLVAIRGAQGRGLRVAFAAAGVALLLLVGAARVVPGAHWPSDVLFTALLFLSWLWVALSLVRTPARGA